MGNIADLQRRLQRYGRTARIPLDVLRMFDACQAYSRLQWR
jgi:hypothetical protein